MHCIAWGSICPACWPCSSTSSCSDSQSWSVSHPVQLNSASYSCKRLYDDEECTQVGALSLLPVTLQASETFKGIAHLEAADSLYSRDCIMLTCTPVADSATADSVDTWQAITLRISSAYPNEAPSVVVRMSRDAQLAPQVGLCYWEDSSLLMHRVQVM